VNPVSSILFHFLQIMSSYNKRSDVEWIAVGSNKRKREKIVQNKNNRDKRNMSTPQNPKTDFFVVVEEIYASKNKSLHGDVNITECMKQVEEHITKLSCVHEVIKVEKKPADKEEFITTELEKQNCTREVEFDFAFLPHA